MHNVVPQPNVCQGAQIHEKHRGKSVKMKLPISEHKDVNHRSLSLPAAGLLQECFMLRKLFIHGTSHEHFLMFLLRILNLRDVQLREDYYPAPENDEYGNESGFL
ncbi:hypothetical protein L1887_10525 [Cichorium endivia]|nr:hypothetical protein L1887_10525 [Cichorium endivia]